MVEYSRIEKISSETGISLEALKYAVAQGELKAAKVGHSIMISQEALNQWLDSLAKGSSQERKES